MEAPVGIDSGRRVEAGILRHDAGARGAGVPGVVDIGIGGVHRDQDVVPRTGEDDGRGQLEQDVLHPLDGVGRGVGAIVKIDDHQFDGVHGAHGSGEAEARGCRLEDAVDKPFVVRETAGRGEGAGFRSAYGGGAEDGRRPVGPHLDGDRPTGPWAVVAIHDGHEVVSFSRRPLGVRGPGDVSIRIGPLVAGEPGVGLEKGRSRIEADDLIRRVGEGVRRFGIHGHGGGGGLGTALAVLRGHRDGVSGGHGGERVFDGRSLEGDAIGETPGVVHGTGGIGRVAARQPHAKGGVDAEGGHPDGPEGDGLGRHRRAAIGGGHGEGDDVGPPSWIDVERILCIAELSIAEIPLPIDDLIALTGLIDVGTQVGEGDLRASVDVESEVGGEGDADADKAGDRAEGADLKEVGHLGRSLDGVAARFGVRVGVGGGGPCAVTIVPGRAGGHRGTVIDGDHVAVDDGCRVQLTGGEASARVHLAYQFVDHIGIGCRAPCGIDGGGDGIGGQAGDVLDDVRFTACRGARVPKVGPPRIGRGVHHDTADPRIDADVGGPGGGDVGDGNRVCFHGEVGRALASGSIGDGHAVFTG